MASSHPTAVLGLFAGAKSVLFDFDGPICHLFERHPAPRIAAELRDWARLNLPDGLPAVPSASFHDPLALLRAAAARHPESELVSRMESRLTSHERRAAGIADPTPGADQLIRRLDEAGYQLAVTTNNSPDSVRIYLDRMALTRHFGERRIHGRTGDLTLMKPNPACLRRALAETGSTPAESLMIGDSAADCQAAARIGVPFLGYARNEPKWRQLIEAGATEIVSSISELLPVLDDLESVAPPSDRPSTSKFL
ncbi:HAD family hydrolase [Streptomyces sp. NPDC004609]|uniref:HAD family hydrolase n=1 Tax=Streptomyces sp. NPDC004609 TaxID=3364704 RepID=UPI00369A2B05